jgi:hypothetical protein
MHVDSLFCYTAHHAGIRESILREPRRIYQIEHSSRGPEGEKERVARVEAKGVPEMVYEELTKWIDLMMRYKAPYFRNRKRLPVSRRRTISPRSVWSLSPN